MCDASDYAVGAVLGQRLEKKSTAICYASKIIVEDQITYTTTEMFQLNYNNSSNKLRTREVPVIHLGEQDHYLH